MIRHSSPSTIDMAAGSGRTGSSEAARDAGQRLRLGMVGGGFIAPLHADGARLSGRWDVVAGVLSSDPDRARIAGAAWHLPPDRIYGDYKEMAAAEAARPDGIDA